MMIRQELHDGWQLTATAGQIPDHIAARSVPAVVPGSTHLDLQAAGLITDPYLDETENELRWMHRADWRYSSVFRVPAAGADERVDLVFDGLDTVSEIKLNDVVLGRTANMHRSYRFDIRDGLRNGDNELAVGFFSALSHAEQIEEELGWRDRAYPHPFNMIRKMACSFGWDWGPDLQTAGIWKPIRLERWRVARLAQVRPLVTVDPDGTGRVEVHVDIERANPDVTLILTGTVDGLQEYVTIRAGETSTVVTILVPDAQLWWPVGYGDHPLYDLQIELHSLTDDEPLDRTRHRVGFRTITVDTTPDQHGTPFTIVVNGRPVFAKGANWIPDDHFLTRITRDRLARRVDQAIAANMNMLRVWGGGIYETEDFYDVCDERGMLVWQDFPFACAAYPEEEPLRGEVVAEARENVARLASHASLALWNGNNENLWGFADWGWPEQLAGRTWGLSYYTDLLPGIVAELDPTRFYSPGSPYSPQTLAGQPHPNAQNHGTRHEWDVWNRLDYTAYRNHIPRFCSEFGFQGPPTWTTLNDWIHDEPLTATSPAFLLHQKAEDGNGKLDRGLAAHLPAPATFDDWHWATQLNQARAVVFGIEHFRSWWPRTAGALVWQLNDCWPATSWAAIDSGERVKPLWYGLRQAFAPRMLTIQRREERLVLVAVNDDDSPWESEIRLDRQTFEGLSLHTDTHRLAVPVRSVACIDLPEELVTPLNEHAEVIVATTAETRAVHVFREDSELSYDPNPLTAKTAAVPGGYQVEVLARSFARDVSILADRVAADAFVDDMLISMLAGEVHSFFVRTAASLDPAALTSSSVLRCVNSLCAPTVRS
jgi:beta-mannosidase